MLIFWIRLTPPFMLQQQYRERQFKKYSEIISCLLVAEQNNELLLKNHQSHPAGSIVAPEMNATESRGNTTESREKGHGRWLGPKKPNNKMKAGNNSHYQKGKKNVFQKHKGIWILLMESRKEVTKIYLLLTVRQRTQFSVTKGFSPI
ncbi:uncharacterized protein LOC113295406 [Papaver somniferum]|uniref:uncharacterized protein LOC113295406 n=1 Tax=Papaver somniferum TaxID=3469 RepID=UPI000E6F58D7|nr:uncharacterized protein LOC113295406 [Papaver somniferum]